MRSLLIYCDGGFGNRFNALVSGVALAREMALVPKVVWPVNNWCGARLDSLLQAQGLLEGVEVIERELASFVPERGQYHYFIVEDRLGIADRWNSPLQHASWESVRTELAGTTRDVFYYTALVPPFVTQESVIGLTRTVVFDQALLQRARTFLAQHKLGTTLGDFIGVQIRSTDFGSRSADAASLFTTLSQCPGHRFLVCSDDGDIEARFAQLPHVTVPAKRAHVQKRVTGGWNATISDHSGRQYPFNVERSAASVEDALVDLLLLARSRIVITSHSTFLHTALILQQAGLSPVPDPLNGSF